jgi:endonuclease G
MIKFVKVRFLVSFAIGLLICSPAQAQTLELEPELFARNIPSVHLLLGNPSQAATNINNPDNYLMVKPQYVLSYNRSNGTPNWVSWQLNKSWFGDAPRQDNFRPDNTLPEGWERIKPTAYNASGYDRGHVAPSADRTRTIEDNTAIF